MKNHLDGLHRLKLASGSLAEMAAGSSMEDEAAAFSRAVDGLAGKEEGVAYLELHTASKLLFVAAIEANPSEASVAATFKVATSMSLNLLLSAKARTYATGSKSGIGIGFGWRGLSRLRAAITWPRPRLSFPTGCCGGCFRFRAAISGPERSLPVDVRYAARRAKLVAKHQLLLGIALATPVALLTSARATKLFPEEYAVWIGGFSLGVLIFVVGGVLLNLHGESWMEFQTAKHLSRLGMMGLTLLLCVYSFFAFFPDVAWLLWAAVATTISLHGFLWIMSCFRGDEVDDSSVTTSQGAT